MRDLALVQQQTARTHGVLVVNIALVIGTDVHLTNPYLAVLDGTPRVFEVQRAKPDGFDLSAKQFDARLEAFLDKVFVKDLIILGHGPDALRLHTVHPPVKIVLSDNSGFKQQLCQLLWCAQITLAVLLHKFRDLRPVMRPARTGKGNVPTA